MDHIKPEYRRKQHMRPQSIKNPSTEQARQPKKREVDRAPKWAGNHKWSAFPAQSAIQRPSKPVPEQNDSWQSSGVRKIEAKHFKTTPPNGKKESGPIQDLRKQPCGRLKFLGSVATPCVCSRDLHPLFGSEDHQQRGNSECKNGQDPCPM